MMDTFRGTMALVGLALDGVGVFVVALGGVVAVARALSRRQQAFAESYRQLREDLGRHHPQRCG
jgi:uncharacterized membrane protein